MEPIHEFDRKVMRVLFVADGNHQLLIGLVEKLNEHWPESQLLEIDILSYTPVKPENLLNYSIYYKAFPDRWPMRIRGLSKYFYNYTLKQSVKELNRHYDIIHIHYVLPNYYLIIDELRKKCSRLIFTFWGSDFFRAREKDRLKIGQGLSRANVVTFANKSMAEEVSQYYTQLNLKTAICKFGLKPLDLIQALGSREESRKALDLPVDVTIITLGYNLSRGQQHIDILNAIDQDLEPALNDQNLLFVIPLTYGQDPSYKNELIERLKSFKYSFEIFDSYMLENDIAHLRNSTDIFVQLQKTDQLSGSMTEHLVAGNIVITGSWLPYQEFAEVGVKLISIDSVNQIGHELNKVLSDRTALKKEFDGNKDHALKLGHWSHTIGSWIEIYNCK